MDPIKILAWIALAAVALGVVVFVLRFVVGCVVVIRAVKRSLGTKPAAGQRWLQDGSVLHITDITSSGLVCIRSGAASWSERPEEFAQRVRSRGLTLINDER